MNEKPKNRTKLVSNCFKYTILTNDYDRGKQALYNIIFI